MLRASVSAVFHPAIRTLVVLVLATGASGLESGCGNSDDKATACVPGQSVACVGDQACDTSFQECKADGSGYGDCLCRKGSITFTRSGAGSGLIGAACES